MGQKIVVEYLHDRQIALVTLNAPKANVLDAAMMQELQAALDGFKSECHLKLVQFTGAGDNFSFGASVVEHTKEQAPSMLKAFHALFYTIMDLAIPTAALVSGQCLGGGLELALVCNFIFVDESARLGQPEISLGVFPPPASLILPMKIGQAKADDLLLTGRSITGTQAVAVGLAANMFATREAMLAEVDQWAQKHILPKSGSSFRYAVKAARLTFNETLRSGLKRLEALYLSELMATHDANEGIASFMERRQPVWQDK